MNGGVTWEQVAFGIVLMGAISAVWFRIEGKITEARIAAEMAQKDLAAYKVQVATEYARNGYIRDVEKRVLDQIDKVVEELHGLRGSIDTLLRDLAKKSNLKT